MNQCVIFIIDYPFTQRDYNRYGIELLQSHGWNIKIWNVGPIIKKKAYHLFEEKPDMVVSGINMGINMGLGFVLSSGTVGACLEANIAGVPAVALSQELDGQVFVRWLEERKIGGREKRKEERGKRKEKGKKKRREGEEKGEERGGGKKKGEERGGKEKERKEGGGEKKGGEKGKKKRKKRKKKRREGGSLKYS